MRVYGRSVARRGSARKAAGVVVVIRDCEEFIKEVEDDVALER